MKRGIAICFLVFCVEAGAALAFTGFWAVRNNGGWALASALAEVVTVWWATYALELYAEPTELPGFVPGDHRRYKRWKR